VGLHRTLLRVEPLEPRQMLSVNILLNTPNPGDLTLAGDDSGNIIQVQPQTSASTPNSFTITGLGTPAATQLLLGGTPLGAPSYTTPNTASVYGNIYINLGHGQNTLTFGSSASPVSPYNPVQGNVTIIDNANDTNTVGYVQLMKSLAIVNAVPLVPTNTVNNTLSNVQIMLDTTIYNGGFSTNAISNATLYGNLAVHGPGPSGATPAVANASLAVSGCTITGSTLINNQNNPVIPTKGNTTTTISGGWLEGALSVLNGDGVNSIAIGAGVATRIGPSPYSPTATPVTIVNGAGGSFTQFTGASAAAPLTVLSGITVTNGAASMATNIVNFVFANVAGAVSVNNGGTLASPNLMSKVTVQNSSLGSQAVGAANPNPVQVNSGVGYDSFNMTGSTAPWGLSLNNNAVPLTPAAAFGSSTIITGSFIGTGIYGANNGGIPATAGQALTLLGDNGGDVVTISSTQILGAATLSLNGGNNNATLQQQTAVTLLNISTGLFLGGGAASPGIDTVSINTCNIANSLVLDMFGMRNNVTINAGTTAGWGQLPGLDFGFIRIYGNPTVPISSNVLTIDTGLVGAISQNLVTGNGIYDFTLRLV
jgi:hypothetical protein